MRTIWNLIRKDLLRDAKHPGGIIVLLIVPVVSALIIALVFSPQSGARPDIVVHLAVLDRDDDFFSGVLRSISNQGEAAKNLQLHWVETEEAGIRLVERRKVSAFVVFPERLTLDLLDGIPTALTLYKNPAEAILPRVVEEALQVICIGVSQALHLVHPEMQKVRELMEREEMPTAIEVAEIASDSVERLRTVEPYLFPPLVQFATVDADDFRAPAGPAPDQDPAP